EMELRYRTTDKQPYTAYDYDRAYALSLRYSMPLAGMTVGAQIDAGKNVFGEDFGRLSGFVRYSQNAPRSYGYVADDSYDDSPFTHRFVEAGGSYSVRRYNI